MEKNTQIANRRIVQAWSDDSVLDAPHAEYARDLLNRLLRNEQVGIEITAELVSDIATEERISGLASETMWERDAYAYAASTLRALASKLY